ncbi:charged multivesicular body protein 1 [Trypanosoma rangeli]|uniref:Charged multivesicular body protein 1 n=1 Tax=Trypanosoma rangeli TaxID=5698 RepID=A0A422N603_TRYRA|nr:charged multivesicular body protein 1 [Trypanosoma rangeli]RNF00889.1 charged multivesicular body protein 1 [Trypanosoma rangeli]|eukprot:RNF00889.1 charged multivesicular body protein 1 [Trypanosoma rangeli]
MNSDKLFDIIFSMKFTIKQMNKSANAAEKASDKEKLLVKKALEKGNPEAARIYAQNAIRKRNDSLNYLRLASRIDAAVSRIQTAESMRAVTASMKGSVRGMAKVMESMDPMKIAEVMDAFEKQTGTLDVNLGTMDAAFEGTQAGTVPVGEVDSLMEQIAAENNLDISSKMSGVPLHSQLRPAVVTNKAEEEDDETRDIMERLGRLRGGAV